MLVVPHPSAGYAAHVFMFSVTLKYIQPLLAYRRALRAPPSTSDDPHRQTRELSIDRLYRHPCKPDAPVPSTRIFSRPRPAPTRPRQSRKKNTRDYRPGATSLGDDTVKLNSRLNTTYSQDLTRRGPRPGVFAIELIHYTELHP